ncbi:hypothetical protein HFX_1913 [Haloferax mediterranei ATCC 33500]|uniref:Uncharacterized protein n=1 Tax=Haloferax mediterranei (strain ATCC 33500 / DSM 1411 / JCM 8866 / NBRC 14739 / NCIMB 2177 / R-4) TaxID=523841 RepID=I3R5V0_HALMT|nr:hypothetical protein HFX_1913 [Haloferax mediterranei ATCC 33500]
MGEDNFHVHSEFPDFEIGLQRPNLLGRRHLSLVEPIMLPESNSPLVAAFTEFSQNENRRTSVRFRGVLNLFPER